MHSSSLVGFRKTAEPESGAMLYNTAVSHHTYHTTPLITACEAAFISYHIIQQQYCCL